MFNLRTESYGDVNRLIDTIEALPDTIEEEALDLAIEYEPLIEALGDDPGPSQFGDGFATEKSRRYYFAMVRSGKIKTDGKNYIRQSKPPFGWKIDVDYSGDGNIVITMGNQWSKARYVFGNRAGGRQVPGHARTGWTLAGQRARELAERFNHDLAVRVIARVRKSK